MIVFAAAYSGSARKVETIVLLSSSFSACAFRRRWASSRMAFFFSTQSAGDAVGGLLMRGLGREGQGGTRLFNPFRAIPATLWLASNQPVLGLHVRQGFEVAVGGEDSH